MLRHLSPISASDPLVLDSRLCTRKREFFYLSIFSSYDKLTTSTMPPFFKKNFGVTLIELLIAMGATVIISTSAFLSLSGIPGREAVVDATLKLAADLRDVQFRSITQDDASYWGVYVDYGGGTAPLYKLYSLTSLPANSYRNKPTDPPPNSTLEKSISLDPNLRFITPGATNNLVLIFDQLTGLPASFTNFNCGSVDDVTPRPIRIINTNNYQGEVDIYCSGRIDVTFAQL